MQDCAVMILLVIQAAALGQARPHVVPGSSDFHGAWSWQYTVANDALTAGEARRIEGALRARFGDDGDALSEKTSLTLRNEYISRLNALHEMSLNCKDGDVIWAESSNKARYSLVSECARVAEAGKVPETPQWKVVALRGGPNGSHVETRQLVLTDMVIGRELVYGEAVTGVDSRLIADYLKLRRRTGNESLPELVQFWTEFARLAVAVMARHRSNRAPDANAGSTETSYPKSVLIQAADLPELERLPLFYEQWNVALLRSVSMEWSRMKSGLMTGKIRGEDEQGRALFEWLTEWSPEGIPTRLRNTMWWPMSEVRIRIVEIAGLERCSVDVQDMSSGLLEAPAIGDLTRGMDYRDSPEGASYRPFTTSELPKELRELVKGK